MLGEQRKIVVLGPNTAWQHIFEMSTSCPGQVNRATQSSVVPSGKGINVARTLSKLGYRPVVCGFSGEKDDTILVDLLSHEGITACLVPTGTFTRSCVTMIETGTGRVTELVGPGFPVTQRDSDVLSAETEKLLNNADCFVVMGSLPPGCDPDLYLKSIRNAQSRNVPVIVDTADKSLLRIIDLTPDVIKVNREEFTQVFEVDEGENSLVQKMQSLVETGTGSVIVTDGPAPVLYCSESGTGEYAVPRMKCINPIGCGDVFTAGVAIGLMAHAVFEDIVRSAARLSSAATRCKVPGDVPEEDILQFQSQLETLKN